MLSLSGHKLDSSTCFINIFSSPTYTHLQTSQPTNKNQEGWSMTVSLPMGWSLSYRQAITSSFYIITISLLQVHGPLRRTSGDSGVLARQLGGGYTLVGGPPDGGPPPARGGHSGPIGQQNMRCAHSEQADQILQNLLFSG